MKLSRTNEENCIRISIRGEVDGVRCNCLEHFWEHNVDNAVAILRIDMDGVDSMDARAVATMVNLIRSSLESGARVVLDTPPQVLAHTLYKAGMLQPGSRVEVVNPRSEEPYAG